MRIKKSCESKGTRSLTFTNSPGIGRSKSGPFWDLPVLLAHLELVLNAEQHQEAIIQDVVDIAAPDMILELAEHLTGTCLSTTSSRTLSRSTPAA